MNPYKKTAVIALIFIAALLFGCIQQPDRYLDSKSQKVNENIAANTNATQANSQFVKDALTPKLQGTILPETRLNITLGKPNKIGDFVFTFESLKEMNKSVLYTSRIELTEIGYETHYVYDLREPEQNKTFLFLVASVEFTGNKSVNTSIENPLGVVFCPLGRWTSPLFGLVMTKKAASEEEIKEYLVNASNFYLALGKTKNWVPNAAEKFYIGIEADRGWAPKWMELTVLPVGKEEYRTMPCTGEPIEKRN